MNRQLNIYKSLWEVYFIKKQTNINYTDILILNPKYCAFQKINEPRTLEKLKTLPPRPSDHDTMIHFFEGKILTVRDSGNAVRKFIDEWLPTFKLHVLAALVRSGANIYFPPSIL